MREILLAFTGGDNPVARADALLQAGLIAGVNRDGSLQPAPGKFDSSMPPTPANLTAGGALATIILSWDATTSKNVAYAEVWRADSDDFSLAALIGRADGRIYTDSIGGAATRYYWIRYISKSNIPGAFNAEAGTAATTAHDASYLLDVLAANPPAGTTYNPLLYVQATDIVIDGVTIPAGVYANSAFLRNLSVTNAQIANLAVDNAKIASLDAAKITAGDIDANRIKANIVTALIGKYNTLSALSASVGQLEINAGGYLRTEGVTSYTNGLGIWMGQVGGSYKMRIGNPAGNSLTWDGTNLTIVGGGTFSGALSAASGTFVGDISAASGNFRGQITGGAFTGYAWPAAGTSGFYLGPSGLLIGNVNNGKYVQISAAGDLYAPGFSIVNGSATFSGAITAASGTFVNTLNVAGNAITQTSVNGGGSGTADIWTTTYGGPIQVLAYSQSFVGGQNASSSVTLSIYRDGILLTTAHGEGFHNSSAVAMWIDSPGTGSHHYTAINPDLGAGWTFLTVLETKR